MKLKTSNSRRAERGVALVITLILLSIITFLAVAFLVISRHSADRVVTNTQQVTAQMAAQEGADQAVARIVAQMLATTNSFNSALVVSTNYQGLYFDTTQPVGTVSITNVSSHDINGNPLTGNSYLQMLNNELILPRPPVFVFTNASAPPDPRFYEDLNRNGMYDPSGVAYLDQFGNTNYSVGDPEWIGILQHPDQPHSRSNLYIARYLFFVQPIGYSLDINYIHNQARQAERGGLGDPTLDGFMRNEGVGSYEINLAAFLNGLNPSYWDYNYQPVLGDGVTISTSASPGRAFSDAAAVLQFRYNNTYANLAPLEPQSANGIDYYDFGPLMTGANLPTPTNSAGYPWSGSDNINHLFSDQDFFVPQNSLNSTASPGLLTDYSNNLIAAGMMSKPWAGLNAYGDSNYDRYTFYRMLAQIGMESSPEINKLNINYDNLDPDPANGAPPSETNFMSWSALNSGQPGLEFFTNAANRLLAANTNFIVYVNGQFTNLSTAFIPIYPTNYYTPAVHQMLQLAANIYDATTNKTANLGFDFPSVFRPTFGVTNIGGPIVFINGWVEVTTNGDQTITPLALPDSLSTVLANPSSVVNLFGAPWVIGARKGFPNFNQISIQNSTQISRLLQLIKSSPAWTTNMEYEVSASNMIGVQAWNSYAETYNRPVGIAGIDQVTIGLSNSSYVNVATNSFTFGGPYTNWQGFPGPTGNPNARRFSAVNYFSSNYVILSNAVFTQSGGPSYNHVFPNPSGIFALPPLWLTMTNRLRFYMVDQASGRVIDYVLLSGGSMNQQTNLAAQLAVPNGGPGGVWATNASGSPLPGITNQIQASLHVPPWNNPPYVLPVATADWVNSGVPYSQIQNEVQGFSTFYYAQNNTGQSYQAPYSPTIATNMFFSWQVNDPLVHYMISDLNPPALFTNLLQGQIQPNTFTNLVSWALGSNNIPAKNYQPWGLSNNGTGTFTSDLNVKDPMITNSDAWQFPDGKFPNIGTLGQVHRGTPWQTVFMKSSAEPLATWVQWTGNNLGSPGNPYVPDAVATHPTNDWALFDLFTTAPNDNATRGQLSVNQTNYAAWAALLGGVVVLTNPVPNQPSPQFEPLYINPDPASNGPAIASIVAGIMTARSNSPYGGFTQLGQILSVPQLSVQSPFLNLPDTTLTDEEYERLPQQIMSLLRVGSPRYVIYAYGQSLKPAAGSLVVGGPYYGTCTNYEITGEVETRTVVSFEPGNPPPVTNGVPNYLINNILNPTHNPEMPLPNWPVTNQPPVHAVIDSFNVLPPE